MNSFQDLPRISKILSFLCFLAALILIGTSAATMIKANEVDDSKEIYYTGILSILTTLEFAFFCVDAIRYENKFQYICCVVLHTLILLFSIWVVVVPSWGKFFDEIAYTLLATTALFELVFLFFMRGVIEEFGFRIYHLVGTKVALTKLYEQASIFFSLLKLDLGVGILLLVLASLYLFEDSSELVLNIIMYIITLGWVTLAMTSVYQENDYGMYIVLAFSLLEPMYVSYKLYQLHTDPQGYPQVSLDQFWNLGAVALLLRGFVIIYAVKVKRSFGQGLHDVWRDIKSRGGDASSPSTPLKKGPPSFETV